MGSSRAPTAGPGGGDLSSVPPPVPGRLPLVRGIVLSALLASAAGALYALDVRRLAEPSVAHHILWPALAAAFAVTEALSLQLERGHDPRAVPLTEVPLVLGLVFCSPSQLLAAGLLGVVVASAAMRQPLVKLTLNLARFALEASAAVVVFHAVLGGADPVSARGWAAAFGATLTVALVRSTCLVAGASLPGATPFRLLARRLVSAVIPLLLGTTLAVSAAVLAWQSFWALWLPAALAAALYLGSRSYYSLRHRYSDLASLCRFTERTSGSLGSDPVAPAILTEARQLLGAERAEVTVAATRNRARRTVVGPGDRALTSVVTLRPDCVEQRVLATGSPLLLARGPRNPETRDLLESMLAREAMVVALRDEDGVTGTLAVANRISDLGTFTGEDLVLFEAIANHAAVAFQNERLVAQLRQEAAEREHRALHDSLTGLPNRVMFTELLEEALASAADRSSVAVLLVDLDRFKEVNDALGHQNGDALLRETAERLQRALGENATVARIAGDEFAALVKLPGGPSGALQLAEDLKVAISEPLALEGLTFEVGASIGISLHPAHGDDAATLLQRADVAKRAAKRTPGDARVYSPEQDRHTPRRLALVGELRQAIENGELTLHYQPVIELRTGELVGAEALLRWPHRDHGFLPPEEFIPVAEHTGLIKPLTELVLHAALQQCGSWWQNGAPLSIAVNMSARSLLDPDLPGRLEQMLEAAGVPAQSLSLELTESNIMAELDHTIGCLGLLSALGVNLSVDDFGTGYSSLSYLKRLPVDEVKIDKSFVLHMGSDANDAAIVRSTVNLARSLGLRVLAEGVEDRLTWDRLRSLGCDLAQGYLISRPLPARKFDQWMRGWPGGLRRAAGDGAGSRGLLRLVDEPGEA